MSPQIGLIGFILIEILSSNIYFVWIYDENSKFHVFGVLVEPWTLMCKKEQKCWKECKRWILSFSSKTWWISEGKHSDLCSNARSPEGSGSKGDERRIRCVSNQFREAKYFPMIQDRSMLKANKKMWWTQSRANGRVSWSIRLN